MPRPCLLFLLLLTQVAGIPESIGNALRKEWEQRGSQGGCLTRIERRGTHNFTWQYAFGRLRTRKKKTITYESPFEIASIRKTFTAASILLLVEEGKIESICDPVGKYIGAQLKSVAAHPEVEMVSLKHLLSQRSGLHDYWDDEDFLDAFINDEERFWQPLEMLDYVLKKDPRFATGSDYQYTDTNYVLLARVIEAVTGESLHKYMRERIFDPLGMSECTFMSYRETAPPNCRIVAHRYEDELDITDVPRQSADWGGGGLISTLPDLTKFLYALANETLLSNSSMHEMMNWQSTDRDHIQYGLGLFRVDMAKGGYFGPKGEDLGEIWGHDGHGNGFMYYWHPKQLSMVGGLNQVSADWWNVTMAAIHEALAEDPKE